MSSLPPEQTLYAPCALSSERRWEGGGREGGGREGGGRSEVKSRKRIGQKENREGTETREGQRQGKERKRGGRVTKRRDGERGKIEEGKKEGGTVSISVSVSCSVFSSVSLQE